MNIVTFSDGYEFTKPSIQKKDYTIFKYRLAELFELHLTIGEVKAYRQCLSKAGIRPNAFAYWSSIPKGSQKAISGDALEKLSDALGIPMRDLKYKDEQITLWGNSN